MRFAIPIFLSLLLQALYGGVDLLVVGQFATTADEAFTAIKSGLPHGKDCFCAADGVE